MAYFLARKQYCFTNNRWMIYILSEFTIYFANGRTIYYEFTIFFAISSLSSSRNYDEFTIYFAISLWIHFYRQITMNLLSASRCTGNSSSFLLIHYLFREFTMNSSSFSRIHHLLWFHFLFREFTILIAISLWIDYLIPSLWIHYCFRDSLNDSYDS